jgi:hypothetical protein
MSQKPDRGDRIHTHKSIKRSIGCRFFAIWNSVTDRGRLSPWGIDEIKAPQGDLEAT